jgi:hypothetical protein
MFNGTVSRDVTLGFFSIETSALGFSLFAYKFECAKKLYIFYIHALFMTTHARCTQVIDTACKMKFSNNCKKVKVIGETALLCKKWTMFAVSYTSHAIYSTACTIDKRFERPWQPIKKYLCSQIVLYSTIQKYINLRGLTTRGDCLKKNRMSKILWYCPFNTL